LKKCLLCSVCGPGECAWVMLVLSLLLVFVCQRFMGLLVGPWFLALDDGSDQVQNAQEEGRTGSRHTEACSFARD
jgi:hypothetical protein